MIKGFLGIFHVGFWGFYVGFSYTFVPYDRSPSKNVKKYYAVRQLSVVPFLLHYALNLLVGHFWGGILLQEIKNGQF